MSFAPGAGSGWEQSSLYLLSQNLWHASTHRWREKQYKDALFFFCVDQLYFIYLHSSYLYHLLELISACKYWKLITCISDRKSSMFLCFMLPVLFYHYSPVLKLITEMESIGDITCNYKVALYYETCKLDLISLSEALSTLALAMTLYIRTLKMILIISANVCLLEA